MKLLGADRNILIYSTYTQVLTCYLTFLSAYSPISLKYLKKPRSFFRTVRQTSRFLWPINPTCNPHIALACIPPLVQLSLLINWLLTINNSALAISTGWDLSLCRECLAS